MIILILIAFHLNKHYEMFKLYQFTAATRAFYHFQPRIQPSFLLRYFSVQNSIPSDQIKPKIKKPRKIRSLQASKLKLDHTTSQEAKTPIEQNVKPLVKPIHNPPSQKDPLHQQLISFVVNNKKQILSKQIDQSSEGKEDLHAMLKKLNRMKKDYLIKTTNDSLIAICTNPLVPSSKRLLKQYFTLLQDHSKHLSRKDALNLINFVYNLQLEDFQEGQNSILKCLSKRLCDIFYEAAKEPNPKFQQTNTIDTMEQILDSPHRQLHQQLIKLVLEDSKNPDLSLSWPEQARMKKLVKVKEEQPNLYQLLSKEFHVKLIASWQRTQGITKDWPQSPEERAVKELTQALVDKFVTSPSNVDNIVTKSNYSKEQRIFVFPILAKYRGTVALRETYFDVLTRLQMGLVDQLTHTSKLADRMWNLVTVLYYSHRSDLEPIHQKGKVEQGEILKTTIPYQCSVLPQIDAVFRQEVFKTEIYDKPDFLRYKLPNKIFMMMSWLIANVIKNDSTPEFKLLVERLQEAHTYLLKETPEADLFDSSVTKFLLQFYDEENTKSRAYLKQLCQAKLFDRKNGLQEAADKIELANIVLDYIPQLDSRIVAQPHKQFIEQLLSSLYYGQALTQTSLFFYRCKHLQRVLDTLSSHNQFSKERDFWLKSEDMILRQRELMSIHKLCQLAHIYSRVNPSQMFWVEIEKTLLSKSSDFLVNKETADSVFKVVEALSTYNRRNETFWKVYGNILSKVKEEFSERELIVLTSVLEASNGQNLFKELDRKYLSQEAYLLPDDPKVVAKLAIALKRHNTTNHYAMGEQKIPLFSLAIKFLIVKVTDMQQTKLVDTDILLIQIKQIAEVSKLCKDNEQTKEIIQLKKVLQILCRELIENIDKELQTAVQDNLVKLKVSLVQIGYEISDSKQHIVQKTQSTENPNRMIKDNPNNVKSTLFKNHPKFRNDNRSRSR